jgi:hypothetical protein
MLPKNNLPKGIGDFRPIAVGSAFYRLWSGIRTKELAPWIQGIVGDEAHGGIKKRSPATALLQALAELQKTQMQDSSRIRHPDPPAIRYVGAADLSKAYDRLHAELAAASLIRLGWPRCLVARWKKAWISQARFLQCGFQISQREVSHISCLPQGDPASPSGLLGPLYESMCRIRKKFEKPKHGRTLYRIFIDDRSWFCSEARTTVAVATAWKKEVAQLSLAENQGKNDFAAFGGIKHRHLLNRCLERSGFVARCLMSPKILGTRLETNRRFHSPEQEELERFTKAKSLTQTIARMPGTSAQKLCWVKGAVINLYCTQVLSKLPALKQIDKVQSQINQALTSVGHGTAGPLLSLFWGHTACVKFMSGWKTTQMVLHRWSDSTFRHGWSARRTHGSLLLARRCLARHQWEELGPWIWVHKINGDVLAPPGALIPRRPYQNAMSKVYRLFANNFEEISHVLRVAWRAIRWEQYLQQNHRGEVLASLHWFDVQESLLKTRNILSSFEPHVRPHVMAVIVAHVVSPAYWGKMEQGGVPAFCSFCNQSHVPDFTHIMWTRMGFNTDRPMCPEALVQRTLGWCDPTLSTEENRRVLRHMARVRAEVVAARWAPAETTAR